jgi:hypothetical protein
MKKNLLFVLILLVGSFGCDDDDGDSSDPVCGDGIINGVDEECDGEYSGQDTCVGFGYYGGIIQCTDQCKIDITDCENNGRCGDGAVSGDETEDNCCEDTGCEYGVCSQDGCVDAWVGDCLETDVCSSEKPWTCVESGVPEYDCSSCACPDDTICTFDVCYSQDELDSVRQEYLPPMDKPLDWYFQLIDNIMDPGALTFDEFSIEVEGLLRADSRYAAVIMGESHGSLDEQNVNLQLMVDIIDRGWEIIALGIEDNGNPLLDATQTSILNVDIESISGNLTNVSYCDQASSAVLGNLNHTDGIYLQYIGSGHTSREVAQWDMHWGICSLPHVAECVLANSRKAITLITFDPNIWMGLTDQVLMWSTGDYYTTRDAVSTRLNQIVDRWDTSFSALDAEPLYDAEVNGANVNVRVVPSSENDDVWFAFFPRKDREPYLTKGFRAIWQVSEIQDYMWDNEIKPGNCSVSWNFTPGEEELTYSCTKDSFSVQAQVHGLTYEVESHTLN